MEHLIKKAARDLVASTYAIALTGAGISTESGIPDYRGPSGIWTKNPQAEIKAFSSYQNFLKDPKLWWEDRIKGLNRFRSRGDAKPNSGHYALVQLEEMEILRCVITQNVDTLHEKAGTRNLIEYHGNILKLRCVLCTARVYREKIDLKNLRMRKQLPPLCPNCGGIMKPDGVAFGEPIPQEVAQKSLGEIWNSDLMLICGTSAVVYPFAGLPKRARQRKGTALRIIEINAQPTPLTREGISDSLIQGKTGEILPRIVEEVKMLKNI